MSSLRRECDNLQQSTERERDCWKMRSNNMYEDMQDGERGQDTVRESLCSTEVNVGGFKSYEGNRLHGESTGVQL